MKLDGIGYGISAVAYGIIALAFAAALVWIMVLAIKFLRLRIAELKRTANPDGTNETPAP